MTQRGGALLFSVVTISLIAALAAASFQLTVATTRRQAGAVQQRTALYLAEAGLAEAYAGLMQGRTGNVGSEQEPAAFGEGLFWVEATPRTDGTIQLESTGMVEAVPRSCPSSYDPVGSPSLRSESSPRSRSMFRRGAPSMAMTHASAPTCRGRD